MAGTTYCRLGAAVPVVAAGVGCGCFLDWPEADLACFGWVFEDGAMIAAGV